MTACADFSRSHRGSWIVAAIDDCPGRRIAIAIDPDCNHGGKQWALVEMDCFRNLTSFRTVSYPERSEANLDGWVAIALVPDTSSRGTASRSSLGGQVAVQLATVERSSSMARAKKAS